MQFTQQRQDSGNLIRRYGADFIMVGEREVRASCIVGPAVLAPWAPHSVAELAPPHLATLFELLPEIVVLATGMTQQFPRASLRAEFATRRIGLEVMGIGAASRTYNVLVSEERKVLAAILLPGGMPSKQSG